MKYDEEEKSIIDACENGKMELFTPSQKEIKLIKSIANSTLLDSKNHPIVMDSHSKNIKKMSRIP